MTTEQWRSFRGWCGHQHIPENDHWDPGALPIGRLLPSTPTPDPGDDDDMPQFIIYTPTTENGDTHDSAGNPVGTAICADESAGTWYPLANAAEAEQMRELGAVDKKAKPGAFALVKHGKTERER